MPIPVIKNFLSFKYMISCKIPLIFFLSMSKSLGFLNKIFFLVNLESNFLTRRQLILVIAPTVRFDLFNSLKMFKACKNFLSLNFFQKFV